MHYILTANTSDEQMWEVVAAKARAQRQVLDHEMIYQSTADLLHSAASAQLQVAATEMRERVEAANARWALPVSQRQWAA